MFGIKSSNSNFSSLMHYLWTFLLVIWFLINIWYIKFIITEALSRQDPPEPIPNFQDLNIQEDRSELPLILSLLSGSFLDYKVDIRRPIYCKVGDIDLVNEILTIQEEINVEVDMFSILFQYFTVTNNGLSEVIRILYHTFDLSNNYDFSFIMQHLSKITDISSENIKFIDDLNSEFSNIVLNITKLSNRIISLPLDKIDTNSEDLVNCKEVLVVHQYNTYNTCLVLLNFLDVLMGIEPKKVVSGPLLDYNEMMISLGKVVRYYRTSIYEMFNNIFAFVSSCKKIQLSISFPVLGSDISSVYFQLPKAFVDYSDSNNPLDIPQNLIIESINEATYMNTPFKVKCTMMWNDLENKIDNTISNLRSSLIAIQQLKLLNYGHSKIELYNLYIQLSGTILSQYLDSSLDYDVLLQNSFNLLSSYQSKRMTTFFLDFITRLYDISKSHIEDVYHILEHKTFHRGVVLKGNSQLVELTVTREFKYKVKVLREVFLHFSQMYSNRAVHNNIIKIMYSKHIYTSIAANLNIDISKDIILKHISLFHELFIQKEHLLRIQEDYKVNYHEDILNNNLSSDLNQIVDDLLNYRKTLIDDECNKIRSIFKDVRNSVEYFKVLDKVVGNVIHKYYKEISKLDGSIHNLIDNIDLILNIGYLDLDILSSKTGIVSFISRGYCTIEDLRIYSYINLYNKLRSCIGEFQEINIDYLYFFQELQQNDYMEFVNYLQNKESTLRSVILDLHGKLNNIEKSLNIREMLNRINLLSFYFGMVMRQIQFNVELSRGSLVQSQLEMFYFLLFSPESLLVKETPFFNRISLFSPTLNDKVHTIVSALNIIKYFLESFFLDLFNILEFQYIVVEFEQLHNILDEVRSVEKKLTQELVKSYKTGRYLYSTKSDDVIFDMLQTSTMLYLEYSKGNFYLLRYLTEMKDPEDFQELLYLISNMLDSLKMVKISGINLKLDNLYKNGLVEGLSFKQHLNGRWFQKNHSYSKSTLPSNCKIAYLDTIYVDGITDSSTNIYNCVVIHCTINSLDGYPKFLSDRAQILEGILLPEDIYNLLSDNFLVHVMAIEPSVEFSSAYINIIESKLILYFMLLPLEDLVYFTNINSLVLYLGEIGRYLTNLIENSFSLFINGNSDITENGFLGTQIIYIFKSRCRYPINILGRYSGFNGEFPVAMAVMDHDGYNPTDIKKLKEVAIATNIKTNINLKAVCVNFVKYKYTNSNIEYAWVLNKHSHLLHFIMFQRAFIDLFLLNQAIDSILIYPVALSYTEERQFGTVSNLFSSLFSFDHDYLKHIFYDPVLGYLYLDIRKGNVYSYDSAESILDNIKASFKRILFGNTKIRKVPYMELDISSNINQLQDLLISQTLPLYASARRNYEANLVLVTLNENFSLQDALKYRILLRSIDAETKLIIRNSPSKSALRKIYGIKSAYLDVEECKFIYSDQLAGITDMIFRNLITAVIQLPGKVSRVNNCPALNEFLSEISIEAIKTQEMAPITAVQLPPLAQTNKVLIDNQPYEVLLYNEDNVFKISLLYLNEQKNGRKYIFMAHQSYTLQDYSNLELSDFVHIYDCVRNIVMVNSETLIRIFYNEVQRDDVLRIIPLLMGFYTGYGISLVENNNEYFIDYDLCINGDCRYFRVFRYLTCNIYETLLLYQRYLNEADDELVLIVPYGERPNIYFAGFNVVTRFGGAFMFRSASGLELHYDPQQFDSACNFALQFYKKNPDLEIKMICYDLNIDDLTIPLGATTCPVGPLTGTEIQPCYASGRRVNVDDEGNILLVTIYEGFELDAIHEILNIKLSGLPVRYTFEGQVESQGTSVKGTWVDIEGLLDIRDDLKLITIKTTPNPKSHILANKVKELIKLLNSSYTVNIIDRFNIKIN
ncbi:uncharacterized protein CMU_037460 [Cryptosporidium muris RN66]|uniref:Uncharacterized protein n=1 Tax=Cryptosporidium muris (strain RN66) TaxID=441375 RepID=B6AH81_CRYMR|nr:uncharacterized protein CMU_037460 [Cryptosporidium muris RN66]EEA07572.1 hypothetical protein CMU_037460 [Cryptosporidium muris RN66]|eukprot:XP_002141921.1 hypothetical protein [Cryptosporidium muris RN66]